MGNLPDCFCGDRDGRNACQRRINGLAAWAEFVLQRRHCSHLPGRPDNARDCHADLSLPTASGADMATEIHTAEPNVPVSDDNDQDRQVHSLSAITEAIKSSIRPLITLGVVTAYCVAAMLSDDPVSALEKLTELVVVFWFGSRIPTTNQPGKG